MSCAYVLRAIQNPTYQDSSYVSRAESAGREEYANRLSDGPQQRCDDTLPEEILMLDHRLTGK